MTLESPLIVPPASGGAGAIPATYTCEGKKGEWPPLRWSGVPSGTEELILYAMNAAPVNGKLFVDWAVAGLDPSLDVIEAGRLPKGAIVGTNSFGTRGYELCPVGGPEIYVFAIYALPQALSPPKGFDSRELRGRILDVSGNRGAAGGGAGNPGQFQGWKTSNSQVLSNSTSHGTVESGTGNVPAASKTVTQHERKQASMNRTRLGLLGLCAALFAIMAFGASGAQAEAGNKWLVGGTTLTNGTDAATLLAKLDATLENNHVELLTTILGAKVAILCTSAQLIGVALEKEGTLSEGGKVKFTGCRIVIENEVSEECTIKSSGEPNGTVTTNEGKGLLVLHELANKTKDILTKVSPKVGLVFLTLELGAFCPLGEKTGIEGHLFLKDCKNLANEPAITHLIEEGPLSSLTLFGQPAHIIGSANAFLTGSHLNKTWSADA